MNNGGWSSNDHVSHTWYACAYTNCQFTDVTGYIDVVGSTLTCSLYYDAARHVSNTCNNCVNPFLPTQFPTPAPTKFPTPAPSRQVSCDEIRNCQQCTTTYNLTLGSCRWCPRSNTCHSRDSISNPCSFSEWMSDDHALCLGSCQPGPGTKASACLWYSTKSGSKDPAMWTGGDFLPSNYINAATCACSGCSLTTYLKKGN